MFNNKVKHGATTIGPFVEVKSDAAGRNFDEFVGARDNGFFSAGSGVQVVGWVSNTNATEQLEL